MADVMQTLSAGVPLTLLLDLAYVSGPDSEDICRREGGDGHWAPFRSTEACWGLTP